MQIFTKLFSNCAKINLFGKTLCLILQRQREKFKEIFCRLPESYLLKCKMIILAESGFLFIIPVKTGIQLNKSLKSLMQNL